MNDLEVRPEDVLLDYGVPGLPDVANIKPAERPYWAHRLRMVGHEWIICAYRAGYGSRQACVTEVRIYLQEIALELDAQQRSEALAMELARLDELQSPYYAAAIGGDIKAAEFVLKVMGHRSKLMRFEDAESDRGGSRTLIITPENYQKELRNLVEGSTEEPDDDE